MCPLSSPTVILPIAVTIRHYCAGHSDPARILAVLEKSDERLLADLRARSDLEHYARKWSTFAEVLFVERADGDLGLCACYLNDPAKMTGFITHLSVVPEFQGSRIGSMLVQQTFSMARERGFSDLRLEVSPANKRAIVFYERLGFRFAEQSRENAASLLGRLSVKDAPGNR